MSGMNEPSMVHVGIDELVSDPVDLSGVGEDLLVPLRQWSEAEGEMLNNNDTSSIHLQNASMLRKVTLAYAICDAVQFISRSVTIASNEKLVELCSIDNFVVRVCEEASDPGWKVKGIETVSPPLSLKLKTYVILDGDFFDEKSRELQGRNVSTSITIHSSKDWTLKAVQSSSGTRVEKRICYLIGRLLQHTFFAAAPRQEEMNDLNTTMRKKDGEQVQTNDYTKEPPTKKKTFQSLSISSPGIISRESSVSEYTEGSTIFLPSEHDLRLEECGCPPTMLEIIKYLNEAGLGTFSSDVAYKSLDAAIKDLHLILVEPERFLFKQHKLQSLDFNKSKLYGRSKELAMIKNVFSHVHSLGKKSEACFISGYSGCGKTRLVEELFSSVDVVNSCVVTKKFEERSAQSPLTRTLSAFNDLCTEVNARLSPEVALKLYTTLTEEFGEAFKTLSQVLPNVLCFSSKSNQWSHDLGNQVSHGLNYHSLCFIVQQFMRVLSSEIRQHKEYIPIVLILDDLQWADPISLGLVHAVLSASEGTSCLMFIGCYRDNEVSENHIVFGLMKMLAKFNVPITKIQLAGLHAVDLNCMISDALSMLPRSCKSLSDIICRKTHGSPFFVIEFLGSLVDRGVVQYSLRQRRWVYDVDAICAEDISPNVLDLLLTKIASLSHDHQSALKVSSCFGNQVHAGIITALSLTQPYAEICSSMARLVEASFLDYDGSKFRFIHDKIREAAYRLIVDKDQFHHHLGTLLQHVFGSDLDTNDRQILFTVVEQINHGIPSLIRSESEHIAVAQLNCNAGIKRIMECNFLSSYNYMKTAVSLLPCDSWSSHYQLSLRSFLYLAKAAYPCGYIDESLEVLNLIIEKGGELNDKIDVYYLLVSIEATNNPSKAFKTCIEVLGYLGENVPEVEIDSNVSMSLFLEVKDRFIAIPEGGEFPMEEHDNQGKESLIMYFYTHLVTLAFRMKPACIVQYISLCTAYAFNNSLRCKHTPNAIVHFASLLCSSFGPDTELGLKIGKIGMSILKKHYSSSIEAPATILGYYGQVGALNERIQECEFMHGRGREIAMQTGNLYMASLNLLAMISRAMQGGKNLLVLKQEIELHQKKAENVEKEFAVQLKNDGSVVIDAPSLQIFQRLIGALIDGEPDSNDSLSQDGNIVLDILYQGRMMICTFYGQVETALEYANKIQTRSLFAVLYKAFYSGLSSIGVYRLNGSADLLADISSSLSKLDHASKFSEWNFANKASLLRAELISVEANCVEAEMNYNAAIGLAVHSNFIHEAGLACELAGNHYERSQNPDKAMSFYRKAEAYYKEWGSEKKSVQMNEEIERIALASM